MEVKKITLYGDTPTGQLGGGVLPECDNPAEYDMPTVYGPWAYLCEEHYQSHTPSGAGAIGTHITWVGDATRTREVGPESFGPHAFGVDVRP